MSSASLGKPVPNDPEIQKLQTAFAAKIASGRVNDKEVP
jgi:hypothetical protein